MSWDLVQRLKERFPEIEVFPREAETHEQAPQPATEERPTAPARPAPRHEAKAYAYQVPGAFVPSARLLEIGRTLHDEPLFRMDYCSFVSAVDRPGQGIFEVVYHLFSMDARHEVLLKVRVPRDDPHVPSVTGIWSGANWHERETYDLFGLVFEGHPDLRRIMMTEDWTGHPLRKDYVYQEPRWLVELATQRQREIEGLGLGERA
jgi:NADH/F420H2 dehydrogenase subunit C